MNNEMNTCEKFNHYLKETLRESANQIRNKKMSTENFSTEIKRVYVNKDKKNIAFYLNDKRENGPVYLNWNSDNAFEFTKKVLEKLEINITNSDEILHKIKPDQLEGRLVKCVLSGKQIFINGFDEEPTNNICCSNCNCTDVKLFTIPEKMDEFYQIIREMQSINNKLIKLLEHQKDRVKE